MAPNGRYVVSCLNEGPPARVGTRRAAAHAGSGNSKEARRKIPTGARLLYLPRQGGIHASLTSWCTEGLPILPRGFTEVHLFKPSPPTPLTLTPRAEETRVRKGYMPKKGWAKRDTRAWAWGEESTQRPTTSAQRPREAPSPCTNERDDDARRALRNRTSSQSPHLSKGSHYPL